MATTNPKPSKQRAFRKSQRRIPSESVKVKYGRGGSGLSFAAQFLDISERGIRIVVLVALQIKEEVEISILGLGLSEPIKCLANVIRSLPLEDKRFCTGLQFHKRLLFTEFVQIAPSSGPSPQRLLRRAQGVRR